MSVVRVPRRIDYGLRVVMYLSLQDPGKCCTFTEIAKQQGVPKKFLDGIIQDLIRFGLIKSKRGAFGGYRLARSRDKISFYQVIEAVDRPVASNAYPNASRSRRRSRRHIRARRTRSKPSLYRSRSDIRLERLAGIVRWIDR